MPTYVLSIQNNTSMIGWISALNLDMATWVPDQALALNQPISAATNAQGLVAIALDTNTPLADCSLTVQFGTPGAAPGPGTGQVVVQFGAQLLNRTTQPFLGAAESTPWLQADVSLFTDRAAAETGLATETYIGLVTIDALSQV